MPNGRSPEAQLLAHERQKRALELRLKGMQYPDIAKEMGMSKQGVERAYQRALAEIPRYHADQARSLALARLDRIRLILNEELDQVRRISTVQRTLKAQPVDDNPDNPENYDEQIDHETMLARAYSVKALTDELIKVEARQARLLGLDQQIVKVDATVMSLEDEREKVVEMWRKMPPELRKEYRELQARVKKAIAESEQLSNPVETTAVAINGTGGNNGNHD